VFCREQVAQLRREVDTIHARGGELVVIGNGGRHFAIAFARGLGLTTPLYVDTSRASYRALGMKRSLSALLAPSILRNVIRALRSGARQGLMQGDGVQLGGVLLVLPGGRVAYRYLSQVPGDHPAVADVLAALPREPIPAAGASG
jgi:peroxiredoxin